MPKVTFIAHDGTRSEVEAPAGTSLMLAAVNHSVRGIDGDCGGQCACATCHVYINGAWAGKIPPPDTTEDEMLNFTAERLPDSRLACQVKLTEALDGIEVRMPIGQH
jgi:ferredoxin, 2Fe-2S